MSSKVYDLQELVHLGLVAPHWCCVDTLLFIDFMFEAPVQHRMRFLIIVHQGKIDDLI